MLHREVLRNCEQVSLIDENLYFQIRLGERGILNDVAVSFRVDLELTITRLFDALLDITEEYFNLSQKINELPEFIFINYYLVIYLLDQLAILSNEITQYAINVHKPWRERHPISRGLMNYPSNSESYERYENISKNKNYALLVRKYKDFLEQKLNAHIHFDAEVPNFEKPDITEVDNYPDKISVHDFSPEVQKQIKNLKVIQQDSWITFLTQKMLVNLFEIRKLALVADVNILIIGKIVDAIFLKKCEMSLFFDMTRITRFIEINFTNSTDIIKYLKRILWEHDEFTKEIEYRLKLLNEHLKKSNKYENNPYLQEFMANPESEWLTLLNLQLFYKREENFRESIEKKIVFYQEQAELEVNIPQGKIDIHWGNKTLVENIIKILHKAGLFPKNTLAQIYSMIKVNGSPISTQGAYVTNSKLRKLEDLDADSADKDLISRLPSGLQLAIKKILELTNEKVTKKTKASEKNKKSS